MQQTIDDLGKWVPRLHAFIEKEDLAILDRIYRHEYPDGGVYYMWGNSFQDKRDAAFMAALTSKRGLSYQAKLVALILENEKC